MKQTTEEYEERIFRITFRGFATSGYYIHILSDFGNTLLSEVSIYKEYPKVQTYHILNSWAFSKILYTGIILIE
ncbi:MAG: hypothetical protein WA131_09215 [Desulfitobacteriaceae bacterium]